MLLNEMWYCFQDGARSIHTAARYGHVGIINTLLQKGESVDVSTNVSSNHLAHDIVIIILFIFIDL